MKKFLLLIIFFLLSIVPSFADKTISINLDFPQDKNIEKQIYKIKPIIEQAITSNDPKLYYEAASKAYNIKKQGDSVNIKKTNDILSALSIEYALQYYEITKDKKYLKKAYKWSKIAIKDETTQIYSIQAAIVLASFNLNLKEMTKAYMLYRKIDIEGAEEYYPKYKEVYNQTSNMVKNRSEERRLNWLIALCTLGAGLGGYSQNYNRTMHTHCYNIGNSVYCDSY